MSIMTAAEALALLDVSEKLETAVGRTYGEHPTMEHFVRVRGASFAVASEVCGTNALPSEEMARLFAAAPALRRAVIALHERVAVHEEEIERETAERDVERAEVLSLRAIIEGRTTPPTDAEIEAHCASGGLWRSIVPGEFILSTGDGDAEDARNTSAVQRTNALIVNARVVRWWAITSDGRPCAWPVMS